MRKEGPVRNLDRAKKELAHLRREAVIARCCVCGERVTTEDRCTDGLYLHRACGYNTAVR